MAKIERLLGILPTAETASVSWRDYGEVIKTHSYQRILTDEAAALIGEYGSRLCMLEGFVGHAERCNIRVRR